MGVGQRVVAQAAHVGGVVVVAGSAAIRSVLIPVYRALGLDWDPATVGSLRDEVPGVTWEEAERAILSRFEERFDLVEAPLGPSTLVLAHQLEPQHRVHPRELSRP